MKYFRKLSHRARWRSATVIGGLSVMLALNGCTVQAPADVDSTDAVKPQVEALEWKMVTTWPKNLPALGVAPQRFADMLEVMSDGRLKIKVYGANELIGAMEVFDAVSAGTAELGHGAAYYWVGKAPVAALFTTIPFGMTAQEMNSWLSYGGGMELWRELYEPFDVVPMACGNSGVQMAGWFNVEINSLDDLKGLKMRIPGLGAEVLERIGATPVSMPGSEIFTSLQSGVIDATEWVGPYNDLTFGLHEVAEYYYYPGWHEPSATIELIANKDAYASLSPDLQMMIEVAAKAVNQDMLDEFMARNHASLQTLVNDHGVQVRRLPDEVLRTLHDIANEVLDEVADGDPLAERIVASYKAFQAEVSEWSNIAEYAYLNARNLE